MDNFVQRVKEIHIGLKYQLVCPLGSGTFGKVYLGRNVDTGEDVAIKLEHHNIDPSLLRQEEDIYQMLQTRAGFPKIYWYGQQGDFNAMVFELLGPNLEDLFFYCGRQFSIKTVAILADQLICRIQHLHAQHYLHRDIKPENFLMGAGRNGNVVYMTDLGLATRRNPTRKPEFDRPSTVLEPSLVGTCRYASINGHLDAVQSKADDLESLGYMLVYFAKGSLPWQGLQIADENEHHVQVLEMKRTIGFSQLCEGLPTAFRMYMEYIQTLEDRTAPNYSYLRALFRNMFRQKRYEFDNVFDWTILEYQRELSNRPRREIARTAKLKRLRKRKVRN